MLASAHAIGVAIPLLTVPWLARTLGPAGWAPVLVAQALAGWAVQVLEFGFDLAGTRDVAQATSDEAMAHTAAAVQRARLLLTPIVAVGVIAVALLLGQDARLTAGTVFFVVARGFSPYWFFQGKQRIRAAAVIDTLGKLLPALALFVLVRSAADGWWVLVLQAIGAAITTGILTILVYRQHTLPAVTNAEALTALRGAAPMFAARTASGLYLQANTLILSLFASAQAVATFGGAERIVRAAINLLTPLTQAIFPRISQLAKTAPDKALAAIRQASAAIVGSAILGAGMLALFGATAVALLLGPSYMESVAVLRVLVITFPLIAGGTVLGIYWALPWHRERLFLNAILVGGVVNLTVAALLVPQRAAMGMAIAVVAAEASVTTILTIAYVRSTRTVR